jgi:hypothetical protein
LGGWGGSGGLGGWFGLGGWGGSGGSGNGENKEPRALRRVGSRAHNGQHGVCRAQKGQMNRVPALDDPDGELVKLTKHLRNLERKREADHGRADCNPKT